ETINAKIEEFNISTKEKFIQDIHSNFSKEAASFSNKLEKVEYMFTKTENNSRDDLSNMNSLFQQIEKIEESNHLEEIKYSNMQKLFNLMKEILNDLSPGNEASLLKSEYKSKSELLITK